jgi:hypothetical protein
LSNVLGNTTLQVVVLTVITLWGANHKLRCVSREGRLSTDIGSLFSNSLHEVDTYKMVHNVL